MTLPVTVVIPHVKRRDGFLERWCLPSVRLQEPGQIVVVDGDAVGAQAARNEGAGAADHPLLFFCDDDIVLYRGCLAAMVGALEADPFAAFAYCDLNHVRYPVPGEEPVRHRFVAGGFDYARLRRESYISAVSLVRRGAFVPWDESLRRMQDWDFFLSVTARGHRGVYIDRPLFEHHCVDDGITATEPLGPALAAIRAKHGPVGAGMERLT